MKISILIANLDPDTIRLQPWSHAFNVAKGLGELGHVVTVFTNRQSNNITQQPNAKNVYFTILPSKNFSYLKNLQLTS
jgi:hypothetical protein